MTEYITGSKKVVIIISSNLLTSEHCERSIRFAIANSVPLLFVKPPRNSSSPDEVTFKKQIGKHPTLSAAYSVSRFKCTTLGDEDEFLIHKNILTDQKVSFCHCNCISMIRFAMPSISAT